MSFLNKIIGDPQQREFKNIQVIIEQINAHETTIKQLSSEALRSKTDEFKQRITAGATLDELLPEVFAVVREIAQRTLGMRHYDVQLLAGVVLHRGQITEMKTGEGKTLVATLPVYLNALSGNGVHVVTVNDYLAQRDATWMGPVYHALGLSVACIQQQGKSYGYEPTIQPEHTPAHSQLTPIESPLYKGEGESKNNLREITRTQAYKHDITYGTNNEFGFDYLRDNMVHRIDQQTQRGHAYAIVDEVDSILIDEARTPLIISGPAQEAASLYQQFARIVPQLSEGADYNIDEKMRAATLTEEGIHKVEKMLGVENLYAEGGIRQVHHLEQALKAHTLFKKDKDYVVRDNEIIIVDEFTGRLMHGRRYSEGLHQAIEAKELVPIQQESVTMATITFQNYFRMYKKLAGMTGTAKTEEEEFVKIYGLPVLEIPTNKPIVRNDKPDKIYKTQQGKFKAVVEEIKQRHELGQPVLVGTASIERNEHLGQLLKQAGVPHEILNAKNHAREAEIIAQAGRVGAVTIATNMAGRGVDIVLGGNPKDDVQAETVKRLGGLHVLGTERHESRRIDNQLRGRSGRQGDPGSSQFFISTEDDLMRVFGSDRMKNIMERLGVPDDMPIEHKLISKSIETAQKKVEGHNFDIRKHVVQYDDVINKQRNAVYKQRQEILASSLQETPREGERINKDRILSMVKEEISAVVTFHTQAEKETEWNLDEIYEVVDTMFPIPLEVRLALQDIYNKVEKKDAQLKGKEAISSYLIQLAEKEYHALEQQFLAAESKQGDERHGQDSIFRQLERSLLLRAIDMLWIEHLDAMDHLRTGIGLRGYGQRDPLVEYKRESSIMFNELQANIRKQVVYSLFKLRDLQTLPHQETQRNLHFSGAQKTQERGHGQFAGTFPQASGAQSSSLPQQSAAIARFAKKKEGIKEAPVLRQAQDTLSQKVGRNDPCPCGSGKKYKKCHGK